jgi:O-antigen/teichoic acid export membrane protein
LALLSGNALAGAIAFAASPLLARLFSPAELGEFGTYVSLLTLALPLVALQYQAAIAVSPSESGALNLIALSIMLSLAICSATAIALTCNVWSPLPASAVRRQLGFYFPVSLFAISLFQTIVGWQIRRSAFASIAQSGVARNLCQALVQIGLGICSFRAHGLFIGDLAGRLVMSASLWSASDLSIPRIRQRVSVRRIAWTVRRYWQFPVFSAPAAFCNSAVTMLPIVLVGWLFGNELAGKFFLARLVLVFPISMLQTGASQIYVAKATKRLHGGHGPIAPLLLRFTAAVSAMAMVLMLAINIGALLLLPLLFGAQWDETITFVQILSPLYFAQLSCCAVPETANVIGRQGALLCVNIGRILAIVVVFAGAALWQWSPATTIAWHSGLMCAASGCLFLMFWRFVLVWHSEKPLK